MTADKTLLDQIKEQVAAENFNKHRWDLLYPYEERELWPVVCERYYQAKAQASCEATLRKAAENAKHIIVPPYTLDKSSITDPSNITIV